MLIKLGVDISRLNRELRRALNVIEKVFKEYGQEAVITSTYEGNHSASSLHYADDAVDFRRFSYGVQIVAKLKKKLGIDYDVVLEKTHIHVEWDPK